MTNNSLALSYLRKARDRLEVLDLLHSRGAYSDVIREAQEIVELALKGILRQAGVEPPKWHDVGPLLLEHRDRIPPEVRPDLQSLASISAWLRRERELAFYGDVDFIPTEQYTQEDSLRAMEDAGRVVTAAGVCIPAPGSDARS